MNKSELVSFLTENTGATKADSEKFLAAFVSAITQNITKDGGVRLPGFGTFKTSDRSARTARNPQTGAEIQIPARKVPVFRPSSALKEACQK